MSEPKKQLHSSHLSMLWKCGYKFERIVIKGEKEPPGIPLIVGSATHGTNAKNLNNKIEKGTLLTREAVQDFARDEFVKEWQKMPVILTEEEIEIGLNKVKGMAQDSTIALSKAYHYDIAPKIIPNRVERPWVLVADGYPFDLAGTWDVDEDYYKDKSIEEPVRVVNIRDTKTRKTDTGQSEVDRSDQYTVYAMAKFTLDKIMPTAVIQDTLIKPTATRPDATAKVYKSTRTKEDFQIFFRRFETACRIIEKGIFTPASSYGFDSPCGYCGFFLDKSCPFINSKRLLSIPKTQTSKRRRQDGTGTQDPISVLESAIRGGGNG